MDKQWHLTIEICEEQFNNEGEPDGNICVNSYFAFECLKDVVEFIDLYNEYSFEKNNFTLQQF